MQKPAIIYGDDALAVSLEHDSKIELQYLWLRDNCPCHKCRIAQTREKIFHLVDVTLDLRPNSFSPGKSTDPGSASPPGFTRQAGVRSQYPTRFAGRLL